MPAHSSPPLTGRGCNQLGTVEKSLRKGITCGAVEGKTNPLSRLEGAVRRARGKGDGQVQASSNPPPPHLTILSKRWELGARCRHLPLAVGLHQADSEFLETSEPSWAAVAFLVAEAGVQGRARC